MTLDPALILLSPEDEPLRGAYRWFYSARRGVYAEPFSQGQKRLVILHRLILGIQDKATKILHKNGNKLDNRRENLLTNVYECPFSPGRLEEMRWTKEKWTFAQIAQAASEVTGYPPVSSLTVRRWLDKAGIALKSRKAISREVMNRPDIRQKAISALRENSRKIKRGEIPAPETGRTITPAMQRQGVKAAAAKKRAEGRIEVTCARLGCGKAFWVHRCRLARYEDDLKRIFCSKSCAASENNRRKKWNRLFEKALASAADPKANPYLKNKENANETNHPQN